MKKVISTTIVFITILLIIGIIPFKADALLPQLISKSETMTPFKVKAAGLKISLLKGVYISRLDLFYPTGEKFAQFDNANAQISFSELFKKQVIVKTIKTDYLAIKLKINPDGTLYLEKYIPKSNDKPSISPNFIASKYKAILVTNNENYTFKGTNLKVTDYIPNKQINFNADGVMSVKDENYLTYDINVNSELSIKHPKKTSNTDFLEFLDDIKKLQFKGNLLAHIGIKEVNNSIKADGIINIDDVSMTVKGKKLPNSFLYLTLLGDKVSIDSELYSNMTEKLITKGMIKLGEKPYIDLKVKSNKIDLDNTFYVFKLFSEIADIEKIKKITGYLKADCNIKGDLNKIKSSGYMKLENVNISTENIAITELNSDIDFSDNVIKIKKSNAKINNAPLTATGRIGKTLNIKVITEKIPVNRILEAKYGITGGVISCIADLKGTPENILPLINVDIYDLKGRKDKTTIVISKANLKIDENKRINTIISDIAINNQNKISAKIPTLKLNGDLDELSILPTAIYTPNSKLNISGKLIELDTDKFAFYINGDGYINPKDFNINEIKYTYPILVNLSGNQKIQNANIQLHENNNELFGAPAIINLLAKLSDNNLKISDLSINSYNNKFNKENLKQNIVNSTKLLIANGFINDLSNPEFHSIKINIPKTMKFNYNGFFANLQGDLSINGKVTTPEIVGQIVIEKLHNPTLAFSMDNIEANFTKNNLALACPNIKLKDSILNIVANLENYYTKGLRVKNINIKSKHINTDDFLVMKSYFGVPNNVYIHNGGLYVEKLTTRMYDSTFLMTDFNSSINLESNQLNLRNFYANTYNGKIAGNIEFNTTDDTFKSTIQGRGISSQIILNQITNLPQNTSGTLDFDSKLSGWIGAKEALEGNVKFIINDGQMNTLGKLEHLLYAQNIIADNMMRTSLSVVTKAITAKNTGLFKYIRGDISISNGWAKLQSIQTLGPNMSMYIKGKINIINNFADLVILGRLSDEVVSSLGSIGNFSMSKLVTMLTGNEEIASLSLDFMENVPMLPQRNTKEFKAEIYGQVDKQSSVKSFKWVSYSQKNYNTKEVPMTNTDIPDFIDNIGN